MLELPPPPSPPGMDLPRPTGDIPPIKNIPELPEFPAAPSEETNVEPFEGVDLPEAPMPEMPEAPTATEEALTFPESTEEPAVAGHELEPEVSVFDRTREEPREIIRKVTGPVFVSMDDYRTVMEQSERVRAKLAEAEQVVHRLDEIKIEEEKVFDRWRVQLEDVERKLGHVDRVIAKAQR